MTVCAVDSSGFGCLVPITTSVTNSNLCILTSKGSECLYCSLIIYWKIIEFPLNGKGYDSIIVLFLVHRDWLKRTSQWVMESTLYLWILSVLHSAQWRRTDSSARNTQTLRNIIYHDWLLHEVSVTVYCISVDPETECSRLGLFTCLMLKSEPLCEMTEEVDPRRLLLYR